MARPGFRCRNAGNTWLASSGMSSISNFHLLSVVADDQFRDAHAQFYRNDKANHRFSKQEESEFQKVRCLVGCKTEFVPVEIH